MVDLSLFDLSVEPASGKAVSSEYPGATASGNATASENAASRKSAGVAAGLSPRFVGDTVYVAVPSAKDRLRVKGVENTVYSMGLPRNSFIDLGDGLAVSSPELLFVEMAAELPPFEHMLLGMELIGAYALDAVDPDNGPVRYDVKPATTIADLTSFAESARGIVGLNRAKRTLHRLVENAWSPAEALIAALLVMPLREDGYAMGPIIMNPRVDAGDMAMSASSRVPDIVFAGSNVGLNYDGEGHFGLNEVVKAVGDVAADPGSFDKQRRLDRVIEDARAGVVSDKRRDRDLLTAGMSVLPVTKEDLYEQGGLDFVVLQAIDLLERQTGRDLSLQRRLICLPYSRRHRQHRIWSLLAGQQREKSLAWLREQEKPVALPPASAAAVITFDGEGNVVDIEPASPDFDEFRLQDDGENTVSLE